MMREPLDTTERAAFEPTAPRGEAVTPASPHVVTDPAATLWFSPSYDGFEADTPSDDSEPGWF